jgi:periplasmic protein TonB
MVRAIPINPWRFADFLERVRPGIAVSAALHVGLFMVLAYFLAFHPQLQVQPPTPEEVLKYVELPKPPPKPVVPNNSVFHPEPTPTIEQLHTSVGTLALPAEDFHRGPPTTTTSTETAPPVIINPKPIYRGGLVYPDRAAEAGMSGYVDFSFIIEPDGSVGNPQVIDEVPDGYGFATAAKKAFPKWRFDPKLVDGKPVAAPAQIRVSFKLQ